MRNPTLRFLAARNLKLLAAVTCTLVLVCALGSASQALNAQQKQQSASDLLHHALYLADLYNWAAAGPEFTQAEKMFVVAGDQRNALYAKQGRLRSTAEQGNVPAISAQLETELATNPLLLQDKQLRMFGLIVKGDIDDEVNSSAMGHDWEQVQALATERGTLCTTSDTRLPLGLVRGDHRTTS